MTATKYQSWECFCLFVSASTSRTTQDQRPEPVKEHVSTHQQSFSLSARVHLSNVPPREPAKSKRVSSWSIAEWLWEEEEDRCSLACFIVASLKSGFSARLQQDHGLNMFVSSQGFNRLLFFFYRRDWSLFNFARWNLLKFLLNCPIFFNSLQ